MTAGTNLLAKPRAVANVASDSGAAAAFLPALTGIRALAAFLVLGIHSVPLSGISHWALKFSSAAISASTSFFCCQASLLLMYTFDTLQALILHRPGCSCGIA